MSFCTAETVSGSSARRLGFSTAFSRRGDAVAGTLGDQPSLEGCDDAEDMEHEFAGGR